MKITRNEITRHIQQSLAKHAAALRVIADRIWSSPEGAYAEKLAKEIQVRYLTEQGFVIHDFQNPSTAFMAEFGGGRVKVGFLGEYDALPGLSQAVAPVRQSLPGNGYGHGCGHNLLCMGALAAAVAAKELAEAGGLDCAVRYYGCPAEEVLEGKLLMIDEGAFRDLDFCMTWHPFDVNKVWQASSLANMDLSFTFNGIPAHAAISPHLGRSALDAVELMNVGVNYLREHVIDQARIHYVITNGGDKPNIVPATAQSRYFVRAPRGSQVIDIVKRVVKIAEGAAMMTETELKFQVNNGIYDYNANKVLSEVLTKRFQETRFPELTPGDQTFYEGIAATVPATAREENCAKFGVKEFDCRGLSLMRFFDPSDWSRMTVPASTDLGDVSWLVPVGKIMGATWALGVANHTWQATACSGTKYAQDITLMMAEILAEATGDLLTDPKALLAVKEEFNRARAAFNYVRLTDVSLE